MKNIPVTANTKLDRGFRPDPRAIDNILRNVVYYLCSRYRGRTHIIIMYKNVMEQQDLPATGSNSAKSRMLSATLVSFAPSNAKIRRLQDGFRCTASSLPSSQHSTTARSCFSSLMLSIICKYLSVLRSNLPRGAKFTPCRAIQTFSTAAKHTHTHAKKKPH